MTSLRLAAMLLCAGMILATRAADPAANQPDRTDILIETLRRLRGIDLNANPAVKAAVLKALAAAKGKPQFVDLVREFHLPDQDPELLTLAIQGPATATGVEALRLVLDNHDFDAVRRCLDSQQPRVAEATVEALGNLGENRVVPFLEPLVVDPKRGVALRKAAVRALVKSRSGAAALLQLAKTARMPADLKLTTAEELNRVRWPELKTEAAELLPLPQGRNAQPLPPISQLVKIKGDAARGAAVFRRETVGCAKCHQINGRGVDFGPNLSEVGDKLGKDALYEAILDPSAGVAFGYDAWLIDLKSGDEAYGLLVSETADEIAIKAVGGIVTRYQKSEIVSRRKLKTSIMPSGLQQIMSTQDLVDLVEYLSTLKKAAPRSAPAHGTPSFVSAPGRRP